MSDPKSKNAAEAELRELYRKLGVDADDLIDRIPDEQMAWVLDRLKEEIDEKGFDAIADKPKVARSGLEMLVDVL